MTTDLLIITLPNIVLATEHPACSNFSSSHIEKTSSELRSIAATCQNEHVAQLFYNRAYHKDLLLEGNALSGIILHNSESYEYQLSAYRLFIALVEEIAPLYYPNVDHRISFLNQVYERRSEVVELRLRGYDKLADRLEKKLLF